jgi:hypothetical protein
VQRELQWLFSSITKNKIPRRQIETNTVDLIQNGISLQTKIEETPFFCEFHLQMDTAYIQQTVGPALQEGLAATIAAHPADPVQYLSDWLMKHIGNQASQEQVGILFLLNFVVRFSVFSFVLPGYRGKLWRRSLLLKRLQQTRASTKLPIRPLRQQRTKHTLRCSKVYVNERQLQSRVVRGLVVFCVPTLETN